jgi:hypothetical protein
LFQKENKIKINNKPIRKVQLPYLTLLLALIAAPFLELEAESLQVELEVAFFFMLSLPYSNNFQNQIVSSAAAEATV